jgi:hypothetical protein
VRVVHNRFGGHAVPHGKLKGITVLQVGYAFVPVVALQATQVRSGDKGLVTVNVQLGLEGKGLIAAFVRLWSTAVNQKHRNRTRSSWQSTFGILGPYWSHRHRNGPYASS